MSRSSKIEVIVNGKVVAHEEIAASEAAGGGSGVSTSSCRSGAAVGSPCACAVPGIPSVFDGPAWAHTSPVYVEVAGQRIASRRDAEYLRRWIERDVAGGRRPQPLPQRRGSAAGRGDIPDGPGEFRKMAEAE